MPQLRFVTCLLLLTAASQISGQLPGFPQVEGERVDADMALNRALTTSSLTEEGTPFHAVLVIGSAKSPDSGRVEVWWAAKQKHKTILTSPTFSQTRIVNGADVMETDSGDYYPRWLENFVDAILGRAEPRTTPANGILQSKLMDAIYESARTGAIVRPAN